MSAQRIECDLHHGKGLALIRVRQIVQTDIVKREGSFQRVPDYGLGTAFEEGAK